MAWDEEDLARDILEEFTEAHWQAPAEQMAFSFNEDPNVRCRGREARHAGVRLREPKELVVKPAQACVECRTPFVPKKKSQRFCTTDCRWDVNRRRATQNAARDWHAAHRFSLPGDGGHAKRPVSGTPPALVAAHG